MLEQFATSAHSIGAILALAMVCLLQYGWHLVSQTKLRRERDELQRILADVRTELSASQEAAQEVEFENRVLCDLISQPVGDIAVRRLLQAFVPLGEPGIAALCTREQGWKVTESVGVDSKDLSGRSVDARIIGMLGQSASVVLDKARCRSCALLRLLIESVDGAVQQLYAFRASPESEPLEALVIASSLPEAGDSEGVRLRAAERLLSLAGRHFHQAAVVEAQEQELRMTREILELRSVVDLEYRSPQELVEQFLQRLASVIEFDFASVHLLRRKDRVLSRLARFARLDGPTSDLSTWDEAAHRLSDEVLTEERLRTHSLHSSAGHESEYPFASAVTVPMRYHDETVGVLSLCAAGRRTVRDGERELLLWSAEYLLETILKTLDRATIAARAAKDALTGLANRHEFDAHLADCVRNAVRSGRECALVLLDLDHFKRINDTFGHPAGDAALRMVSRLILNELQRHVRGTDHPLAARYGGEELAIILPGLGSAGGLRVAEQIRSRVESSIVQSSEQSFQVSLSAGVAVTPTQAETPEGLIEVADAALYEAKSGGRNRVFAAVRSPAGEGQVRFIAP